MITTITNKLEVKQTGQVLLVTIKNPPANTWDFDSLAGLAALLEDAEKADIAALVITGEGHKFFSAGADLKLFALGDKIAAKDMAEHFGKAFEALAAFSGVTIAAINGYAMGGGLECALACDIRIAAAKVMLALPEASVGLLPCGGGTQNLVTLVGEGWAKRIILCGERVSAEKALAIGLVEQVTEAEKVLPTALALAEQATYQSPTALLACKKLIDRAARTHLTAADYEQERTAFVALFDDPNQQEGVKAFFEKRPPKWQRS